MIRHVLLCGGVAAALACAVPAAAQGNGNAFGRAKNVRPPQPTSSVAPAGESPAGGPPEVHVSGAGVRNFGSWLDDATVLPPGQAFMSLGFGVWQMPGYREIDFPTLDTAVGVHRIVQVGASVPYFYASEPGGVAARGLGTVYLSAKVQLKAPHAAGAGLSLTPAIEMLNAAPPGGDRLSWAVPLNIEIQRAGWRTYGSAGYFSRGAVFTSAALEKALSSRMWATSTVSHSYSVREDLLSLQLGLARSRVDVSGGVGASLSPAVAVFGGVGRTISKRDANSSSLVVSAGLSFSFGRRS